MFKIFRVISTVHTFCNRDLMAKAVSFLHFVESSLTRAADIGIKNIPAWSFKIFYKKKDRYMYSVWYNFPQIIKGKFN